MKTKEKLIYYLNKNIMFKNVDESIYITICCLATLMFCGFSYLFIAIENPELSDNQIIHQNPKLFYTAILSTATLVSNIIVN